MGATSDIFAAIDAGDVERLRELVRNEPSTATARDETGVSVLLYAHYRGAVGMVAVLREARSEMDVFEAAALGDTERLRTLVDDEPALIQAWSPDGFNPLHLASFFGHEAAAEFLLERGADVNAVARNPMLVAPLHSAIAGRHADIARALVVAGADVNAQQQENFTPLHEAAQNGDSDVADFLVRRGADREARLVDGRTPAELARDHGHADLADRLDRSR